MCLLLFFRSAVDQYFGLIFDTEIKCIESEDEPVTKSQERFLQYNCYIDKDVKFLASGLKNVSSSIDCSFPKMLLSII